MHRCCFSIVWLMTVSIASTLLADDALRVLIVDGQNNHHWQATTPVMKKAFEQSERFTVDVATSPPKGHRLKDFCPDFAAYDVVVSNYNGAPWSPEAQSAFLEYMRGGGGFVVVHAANNAFPNWKEYNRLIGLGGWNGRDQRSGPYVYIKDDQVVRDETPGPGGSHGPQHEFHVVIRDRQHPVTQGMPVVWRHAKDELYDSLRGPAEQMTILATAFSPKSGRHEPMIFTVQLGEGRVFHTPMGHADYSMRCVGFLTTLLRGAEWAATGQVTQAIPDDFPTADEVRSRDDSSK